MGNELVEVPMEVELLDTTIDKLELSEYTPVPISEISTYGIVGNELFQMIEAINKPGGEGIYRVSFPNGVRGTLTKFKNENAFFGAISVDHGITAQARLTQVPFNPEHLFMAIALMDINVKLGEILKNQKKMLEFLYAKEESNIYGNYNMLNEAIGKYRYNWDQDKYIDQNIVVVSRIKNDMYKTINLYRRGIATIISARKTLHRIEGATEKVQELSRLVRNYHDAHYLLEYATFFEVLLMKNFNGDNLENIKSKISADSNEYRSLYNKSCEWAEKYITSSFNYKLGPMFYASDKKVENILKKIPLGLDKKYGDNAELYRPVEEQMKVFKRYKETGTSVFEEEISLINAFHNKELEMFVDKDNIYLLKDTEE